LLIIALLAGGGAGIIGYGSSLYSRPESRLGKQVAARSELEVIDEQDTELDHRRQVFEHRIAVKDEVVRELVSGHLTLVQAAVRFRDVERDLPVSWAPTPPSGVPEEDERMCRDVIRWARLWVSARLPAESASVVARLKVELEKLRGSDGVVRLPDQ